MFWIEIGPGFGEPGGTPLPRIPRSTSSPPGSGSYTVSVQAPRQYILPNLTRRLYNQTNCNNGFYSLRILQHQQDEHVEICALQILLERPYFYDTGALLFRLTQKNPQASKLAVSKGLYISREYRYVLLKIFTF